MQDDFELTTLTLSLPEPLKQRLEEEAKRQDRSVSALARVIIRGFLESQKNEQVEGK